MLDLGSIKRELKEDLRPRKMIRYALVPHFGGIMNPMKDVFGLLVRTIALLFVQSKLLPQDHPVLRGEVRGVGAIWLMIVDASANLKFTKQNIPQIAIFYAIVGMIVFSVLGTLTFLMKLGVGSAHADTALPTTNSSIYAETSGLAFSWVNNLFPITGGGTGLPAALGAMLQIYNTGILVLASGVALWSIIMMIMESAHHGEIGGKRHSELFAPLRLIFAIGLLVPVSSNGFNGIQVLTVYVAHAGSALANVVWNQFAQNLFNVTPTYNVQPTVDLNTFAQNATLDIACNLQGQAISTVSGGSNAPKTPPTPVAIPGQSSTSNPGAAPSTASITLRNVIVYSYQSSDGLCGTVTIGSPDSTIVPGHENDFLTFYTDTIVPALTPLAQAYINAAAPNGSAYNNPTTPFSGPQWQTLIQGFETKLATTAQGASKTYTDSVLGSTAWAGLKTEAGTDGWAGAGAIFFRLANIAKNAQAIQQIEMNASPPNIDLLPVNVEAHVADSCLSGYGLGAAQGIMLCPPQSDATANILKKINTDVQGAQAASGKTQGLSKDDATTQSVVTYIFDTVGLSNMTKWLNGNFSSASDSTSATAVSFGQPIFSIASFGNILMGITSALFAGAAIAGVSVFGTSVGMGFATVFTVFGTILFPMSLILSVYLPLIPAIRFFFGIMTWLMTIFEAMVTMPIILLYSIQSHGEGLFAHGQQGYLIILQMMLRPVLMIFGLLASITIFDTLYNFLGFSVFSTWWGMSNSGQNMTSIMSMFAFVLVYGFLLYSVANVAFSAINGFPDRVLAWLGSSTPIQTQGTGQEALEHAQSMNVGFIGRSTDAPIAFGQKINKNIDQKNAEAEAGAKESRMLGALSAGRGNGSGDKETGEKDGKETGKNSLISLSAPSHQFSNVRSQDKLDGEGQPVNQSRAGAEGDHDQGQGGSKYADGSSFGRQGARDFSSGSGKSGGSDSPDGGSGGSPNPAGPTPGDTGGGAAGGNRGKTVYPENGRDTSGPESASDTGQGGSPSYDRSANTGNSGNIPGYSPRGKTKLD